MDKKFWPSEKIFQKDTLSIVNILNHSTFTEMEVFTRNDNPEDLLKKKLVELYTIYRITLYKKRRLDGTFFLEKRATVISSDSNLKKPDYYPLCFCEYENFSGLMPEELGDQIFNINHSFSKWLIKSYSILENNYSNHLYILLNNSSISIINLTINKLRALLADPFKPPINLRLTESDFEINIDSLPNVK